jgi:predicted MPP superfamily phosphohydrolase
MMPMRLGLLSWLLHGYVALRVGLALPSPVAGIGFALAMAGSAWLLPRAFGAGGRRGSGSPLRMVALVAMGLGSSLFVFTLLRDLGLAAVALAARWTTLPVSFAAIEQASAIAVVVLAVAATAVGFAAARRTARVVRVTVPVADLAPALDGFTVAQLSDVHVGPTIRRRDVEAIVARVNALDADLVAITGDLVDGSVAELADEVAPLAGLASKEGTFFVTGNHEYYAGATSWVAHLRRLGMCVLLNQHVAIVRNGAEGSASLVVAGVTDASAGHFDRGQASDPVRALAGSPDGAFRLLLAHQPRSAAAAAAAGADLQLSGHTHGGQFWPWNHFVRLQQPFTAGLARLGRMWIYTSRGTGYWGPPKRFGAPSEITLLTLRRTSAAN